MTTLSVGRTLEDGIERLTGDGGRLLSLSATLYAAFLVLQVGTQSQLAAQPGDPADAFEEFPALAEALGPLLEGIPERLPLALDVPLGVAWSLWLVGLLSLITVSMVAFRELVDERSLESADHANEEPGTDAESSTETHSLPGLAIYGVAAAIVGTVAVSVGLALFVLPGLVVATVFAFTHPYIATRRVGVSEAMKRSLEVTRGNRLRVFGVLVAAFLSYHAIMLVAAVATLILDPVPLLSELVHVGFVALAWLLVLAILASAFERLERARAERERKWDGIDDELLP